MQPVRNNNPLPNWQLVGVADKWGYALLGIDDKLSTFRTCATIMPDVFRLDGDKLYANMSYWYNSRGKK